MPPRADSLEDGDASLGVLICDDFEAIREALRDVIASAPTLHVIGEAGDGAEALSEARRLQPDVILLDLAMPVMTGLEALPELRSIVPNAAIVVLSGFASSTVADQVRAAGGDGYVEKGTSVEGILGALTRAVENRAV